MSGWKAQNAEKEVEGIVKDAALCSVKACKQTAVHATQSIALC